MPRVAIVNRTFARVVMRTSNALGRHFAYGWRADPVEIVGIVEDGKYEALTEGAKPAVFECALQRYNATTVVLVKSTRPSEQIVAEMRQAIGALDPALPLYMTGTVGQMLGFALFPSEAAAVALSAFGLLALVLAATGIYGLVAYSVSRRRREIGIRVAIGASRARVLRSILGRIGALVAAGAVVGLAVALAAGRLLSEVVYQVSPHDPAVLATVGGVIAIVAGLAAWAPARRSLRIEPRDALRDA
jgi:cell division protein FtsX